MRLMSALSVKQGVVPQKYFYSRGNHALLADQTGIERTAENRALCSKDTGLLLSVEQIEIFFKAHAMLARCILGSGLFDCRLQECNCFVKRLLQGHFIDQTTGYAGSEQIAGTGEAFSGVGSLYEAASLTCNSKICNPGFFGISRNNTCYDNGLFSDCLFQKGKGSFFYIAEIFRAS